MGIVAPKVILGNGETQECNMGIQMTLRGKYLYLLRKTPLAFLSKGFVNRFHVPVDSIKQPMEVYGVSGCFLIFSRECMENIGLLDDELFLYEEENVLGVKMDNVGMKTILDPRCSIIHNHGQTTKNLKANPYIWFVESEIVYCKKYLNKKNWEIYPLVMFRKAVFAQRMLHNKDYREAISEFKMRIKAKLKKQY